MNQKQAWNHVNWLALKTDIMETLPTSHQQEMVWTKSKRRQSRFGKPPFPNAGQ